MLGKKSFQKSAKTRFLYSHECRDQKRGGKNARNNFSRNTNSASKKCWEKNYVKTLRKHVFYIHTNIVTKKWGEKNTRNNFSRNTRIVRAKYVGKKSSHKCSKTRFLYSH